MIYIYINDIKGLYIVVGGDHVKNGSVQPVDYILFSKDNGIILKHTIIKYLGDSISLLNESTIFNNQQISPSNIYIEQLILYL